MLQFILALFLLVSTSAFSEEQKPLAVEIPADFYIDVRGEQKINGEITAYIQGALDGKYPGTGIVVDTENGCILLTHFPEENREDIQAFTEKCISNKTDTPKGNRSVQPWGMWFPQSTVLFPTQVANSREVAFSLGHRFGDSGVGGRNTTTIILGDYFPVYRWSGVGDRDAAVQLGLEASLFTIFNQDSKIHPLINSDYYVGVPISYRVGNVAMRLRGYHISSHLGDEFLISHNKKKVKRKNKSFEAIDFFTAWDVTKSFCAYAGIGIVTHSDSEQHVKPFYFEYGAEYRPEMLKSNFKELYGQPFLAVHVRNWQDNNYNFDRTIALGYEWGKSYRIGKKVRLYFAYHNGFSPDGQFSRDRVRSYQLVFAYGF